MPLLFSLIALGQRHLAAILRLLNRQMSVLSFQLENIPQNLVYSKSSHATSEHFVVIPAPPAPLSQLEIAISEKQWVCACCRTGSASDGDPCACSPKSKRPKVNLTEFPADFTPKLCAKCNCQRHRCPLLWRANFKLLYKTFQMLVYGFIYFWQMDCKNKRVLLKQTAPRAPQWVLSCHTLAAQMTRVLVEMCC